MQHYEEYILTALEIVFSWELPEDDLANQLNDQVRQLAGLSSDDLWESPTD